MVGLKGRVVLAPFFSFFFFFSFSLDQTFKDFSIRPHGDKLFLDARFASVYMVSLHVLPVPGDTEGQRRGQLVTMGAAEISKAVPE